MRRSYNLDCYDYTVTYGCGFLPPKPQFNPSVTMGRRLWGQMTCPFPLTEKDISNVESPDRKTALYDARESQYNLSVCHIDIATTIFTVTRPKLVKFELSVTVNTIK